MDQPESPPETTLEYRVSGLEEKLGKKSNVVGIAFNLLTILVATVALAHSCGNNRLSEEANGIANEALRISTNQFVQLNRPYLTVTLQKDSKGFFVSPEKHGTSLVYHLSYEISNIGSVAAKEMVFPPQAVPGPNLKPKLPPDAGISLQRPKPIGIPPGGKYPFRMTLEVPYLNELSASNALALWGEGKTNAVTVGFSVSYKNAIEPTRSYRTIVNEKVRRESIQIIDSDFIDL